MYGIESGIQLTDALYLLLPESAPYQVLSTLDPPDPTNPLLTTTFKVQTAIYDSLTVLEEIIAILEREEESFVKKEFEKRRTRLNAGPADQIRKEIGREVWGKSRASLCCSMNYLHSQPCSVAIPLQRGISSPQHR